MKHSFLVALFPPTPRESIYLLSGRSSTFAFAISPYYFYSVPCGRLASGRIAHSTGGSFKQTGRGVDALQVSISLIPHPLPQSPGHRTAFLFPYLAKKCCDFWCVCLCDHRDSECESMCVCDCVSSP